MNKFEKLLYEWSDRLKDISIITILFSICIIYIVCIFAVQVPYWIGDILPSGGLSTYIGPSDLLNFLGSFVGAMGTIILGISTIFQSYKIEKKNQEFELLKRRPNLKVDKRYNVFYIIDENNSTINKEYNIISVYEDSNYINQDKNATIQLTLTNPTDNLIDKIQITELKLKTIGSSKEVKFTPMLGHEYIEIADKDLLKLSINIHSNRKNADFYKGVIYIGVSFILENAFEEKWFKNIIITGICTGDSEVKELKVHEYIK